MQAAEVDLFGAPTPDPEQSQWFTPMWLAKRLARWVLRGARVLEPACGSGNLIEALLLDGHDPKLIMGIERDERMAKQARERFYGAVNIVCADFLTHDFGRRRFDVVPGNFPFENNAHMHFTIRALELAPVICGIYPVSFRFGVERDRELWAECGAVTNMALLPERVNYGGTMSPQFDSVALRIMRREHPRVAEARAPVYEEVWRP